MIDQKPVGGDGPAPINPANPSFVIGTASVTPLAQAAAFATFANKGEYCKPRAITSVEDKDGTNYKVPQQECSQEIDPQYVADLNGTLKKIATNRVSKGQVAGPIAGKTGTNNGATSTWFVGYSTGISSAAWVGRLKGQGEEEKKNWMHGKLINNQRAPEMVDSSTYAAPLWVDFMSKAVQQYDRSSFGSRCQRLLNQSRSRRKKTARTAATISRIRRRKTPKRKIPRSRTTTSLKTRAKRSPNRLLQPSPEIARTTKRELTLQKATFNFG